MDNRFKLFQKKMEQAGIGPLAIRHFEHYYGQLLTGETGLIRSSEIEPLTRVTSLNSLAEQRNTGVDALSQLIVIKLNGGLGTSMGLDRAKSLLPVKDGHTFLDIIVRQVLSARNAFACDIPLVFMNSFRTEEDTLNALGKYPDLLTGNAELPLSFMQNRVPKVGKASLGPVTCEGESEHEWCPPGHGDIYTVLVESGLLEQALTAGFRYAFVSNSDNLGATLDSHILGHLVEEDIPFLMEVAERTAADRKGGHLAQYHSGTLVLRELAQSHVDDREDFQNFKKYRFFNTNSLWLNLEELNRVLKERDGQLGLPLIRNEKRADPRDPDSSPVFQLETAMGTAISCFDRASALLVPRSRFRPVKTTENLLELWSDIFFLDDDFLLTESSKRSLKQIVISLDPRYYAKIDDFESRFRDAVPSLVYCNELTIEGDIQFTAPVTLSGTVRIRNSQPLSRVVGSEDDLEDLK